ncbi:MAG: DUF4491 family protein [Anaerolineales bacterium]|nr:DUF4491 family protein [Anaerolineales bacterium]
MFGLVIGILTLLIIGLGFPLVILTERYLGYLWWPYMLGIGMVLIGLACFLPGDIASALVGVLGATFAWGATELRDQARRAELGWFPYRRYKIRPPLADKIARWRAPNL